MKNRTFCTIMTLCLATTLYACSGSDLPKVDKLIYTEPTDDGPDWTDKVANYDKPFSDTMEFEGVTYEYQEQLSDEFNGTEVDTEKWHLTKPGWGGRGAAFRPENLIVEDGCLHLKSSVLDDDKLKQLYQIVEENYVKDETLHYGDALDVDTWDPATYGSGWQPDWSAEAGVNYNKAMEVGLDAIGAAAITSIKYGGRGIYEARIKCSRIAMSSAFWLQGDHNLEYDITESYGYTSVAQNNENKDVEYKISTSVWLNTPQLGGGLGAVDPQRIVRDVPTHAEFFILRLEWGAEKLVVKINDEELYNFKLTDRRTMKPDASGNYFAVPIEYFNCAQQVIFDTEILMGPACGWPTRNELLDSTRNRFSVDWVRVYKDPAEDWSQCGNKDGQWYNDDRLGPLQPLE